MALREVQTYCFLIFFNFVLFSFYAIGCVQNLLLRLPKIWGLLLQLYTRGYLVRKNQPSSDFVRSVPSGKRYPANENTSFKFHSFQKRNFNFREQSFRWPNNCGKSLSVRNLRQELSKRKAFEPFDFLPNFCTKN